MVCLVLALKKEETSPLASIKERFFNWEINPYDIEHIYSYDSFTSNPQFDDEAKAIFNGIGNLVVLDRKINRAMGMSQTLLPIDKYKARERYYDKSKYKIVTELTPKLKDWNLDEVKKRSDEQIKILTELIMKK